jgi:hypothetical protein
VKTHPVRSLTRPAELEDDLVRRHLELFVLGLRGGEGSLEGPELARAELSDLAHQGPTLSS